MPYDAVKEKLRSYNTNTASLYVASKPTVLECARKGIPISTESKMNSYNNAPWVMSNDLSKPAKPQILSHNQCQQMNKQKNLKSNDEIYQNSEQFMSTFLSKNNPTCENIKNPDQMYSQRKKGDGITRPVSPKFPQGTICHRQINNSTSKENNGYRRRNGDLTMTKFGPFQDNSFQLYKQDLPVWHRNTNETKVFFKKDDGVAIYDDTRDSGSIARQKINHHHRTDSFNSQKKPRRRKLQGQSTEKENNSASKKASKQQMITKFVFVKQINGETSPGIDIMTNSHGFHVITQVLPNSAAEFSGLKVGDIITVIDTVDVTRYKRQALFNLMNDMFLQNKLHMIIQRMNTSSEGSMISSPLKTKPFTPDTSVDASFVESLRWMPDRASPQSLNQTVVRNTIFEKHIADNFFNINGAPSKAEETRTIRIRNGNNSLLGFDLKTITIENESGIETMHALGKVIYGLPGQQAGMKEADRIVSINGIKIDHLDHSKVLNIIKENIEDLIMVVKEDEAVKSAIIADSIRNSPISRSTPITKRFGNTNVNETLGNRNELDTIQVVLKTDRLTNSIGLSVTSDLIVYSIDPSSEAEKSAIEVGDKIIEINDHDVSIMNSSAAFELMKKGIQEGQVKLKIQRIRKPKLESVNFGAVSNLPQNSMWTANSLTTILTSNGKNLPCGRTCRIENIKEGSPIGLSIKENENAPHEVIAISPGTPADKCGISIGDLIIAVNGMNVHTQSFEFVKNTIKSSQKKGHVILEVIDPAVYAEIKGQVNNSFKATSNEAADIGDKNPPGTAVASTANSSPEQDIAAYKEEIELEKDVFGNYFIKRLTANSKADKVGLRKNDFIISVNGINLSESDNTKATNLLMDSIDKEFAEIIVRSGGHDALCIIKKNNVIWRTCGTEDLKGTLLKSVGQRYISEPDIASKMSKDKSSYKGNSRRKRFIEGIKSLCSRDRFQRSSIDSLLAGSGLSKNQFPLSSKPRLFNRKHSAASYNGIPIPPIPDKSSFKTQAHV